MDINIYLYNFDNEMRSRRSSTSSDDFNDYANSPAAIVAAAIAAAAAAKAHQKRHQERNHRTSDSSAAESNDDEIQQREQREQREHDQNNLRKQCTKAAALRNLHHNANESTNFNSMTIASKKIHMNALTTSTSNSFPLAPHQQLWQSLSEEALVCLLDPYVIEPHLLRVYGFPVESAQHRGCIEFYKCTPKEFRPQQLMWSNGLYVNVAAHKKLAAYACTHINEYLETDDQIQEILCVRCNRPFLVRNDGTYLTCETCYYHPGRLLQIDFHDRTQYTCCFGDHKSRGCENHTHHVWSGTVEGRNGPFIDFVHTQKYNKYQNREPYSKVYALDCEMSYTGRGLELTKVSVVAYDGQLVYEHFVLPDAEVVDYNTRFSGISEEDLFSNMQSVKTLFQVQQDLLQLIYADTILVGHALDNDLRTLRIVHQRVIDTSIIFPHPNGYPYRLGLKRLTLSYLNRRIQSSTNGHNSFEDSSACLELVLWMIQNDISCTYNLYVVCK